MPKRMGGLGPTRDEIEAMLDAALTAPDHNQLCPWRVVLIAHESRDPLAESFLAGKRRRKGERFVTADDVEREFDKARHPPVMLAVVTNLTYGVEEVPVEEQYVAIGASLQNILLSAHALGYGAVILSGNRVRDREVRSFIGVDDDQHLVGFVCMGSVMKAPRPVVRSRYSSVLTETV